MLILGGSCEKQSLSSFSVRPLYSGHVVKDGVYCITVFSLGDHGRIFFLSLVQEVFGLLPSTLFVFCRKINYSVLFLCFRWLLCSLEPNVKLAIGKPVKSWPVWCALTVVF